MTEITAQYREDISTKLATNTSRKITASKFREVLLKGADLLDSVFSVVICLIKLQTKAEADSFTEDNLNPAIIIVATDETQGGARATYFYDGVSLQEFLLL